MDGIEWNSLRNYEDINYIVNEERTRIRGRKYLEYQ